VSTYKPLEREARMQRYCELMVQIKARLLHLEKAGGSLLDSIAGPELTGERAVEMEMIAVQLRKVLELLAYSALLANEKAAAAVRPDFGGMRKAKKVLLALEKINPHFFPHPLVGVGLGGKHHNLRERPGNDYFTKAEFAPLFDACGAILHVANPFAAVQPMSVQKPRTAIARIRNLLECHVAMLSNTQILIVQMGDWTTGGGVTTYHAEAL
jgi:hypothetical protein